MDLSRWVLKICSGEPEGEAPEVEQHALLAMCDFRTRGSTGGGGPVYVFEDSRFREGGPWTFTFAVNLWARAAVASTIRFKGKSQKSDRFPLK